MQRTCLKCAHVNNASDGGDTEACPACGVIYSKFNPERWQALQARREEVRHANTATTRDGWKYAVVGLALVVLLPWWIYQEVWGITAQQRKSEASRMAVKAARGVVQNSGWDGSVYQVEQYLKRNLKDPDSFQAIEWSPVVAGTNNGYVVRVKYRAKNSLGGYVIEQQIFQLDSQGAVVNVTRI